MKFNPLSKLFIVTITALTLTSCMQSTTKKSSVGVDRQQIMTVSSSEMKKGAVKAYSQVLAEAKKKGNLNPSKKQLID